MPSSASVPGSGAEEVAGLMERSVSTAKSFMSHGAPLQVVRTKASDVISATVSLAPKNMGSPAASLAKANVPSEVAPLKACTCAVKIPAASVIPAASDWISTPPARTAVPKPNVNGPLPALTLTELSNAQTSLSPELKPGPAGQLVPPPRPIRDFPRNCR